MICAQWKLHDDPEPICLILGSWRSFGMHGWGPLPHVLLHWPLGWRIMGNLISRPSCLGQKSKHVRSDQTYMKECYQRQREWQPQEQHVEDKKKEQKLERDNEAQETDHKREEGAHTPISEKPLSSSPASTIRSTSTLDNAWHSTPSPFKMSRNGTLTRRTVPSEFARSPLAHLDKNLTERRSSYQRRDSREGSPWSWKTVASREVTEVTEVTETIVTEIVEVTEYPSGDKGGDPIITRTVRVLNGVAEELAEVDKKTKPQTLSFKHWPHLSFHSILLYPISTNNSHYFCLLTNALFEWLKSENLLVVINWCRKTFLLFSSKVMDTHTQTRILLWINGGFVVNCHKHILGFFFYLSEATMCSILYSF